MHIYMHISFLFISSFLNEHLGCFHLWLLWIVQLCTCIQVHFSVFAFNFFGYVPKNRIAELRGCPGGPAEPEWIDFTAVWGDTAWGRKKGCLEAAPDSLPWRHRGRGPWRMAFLLATGGVSRPWGSGKGAGPHPWVPGVPAAWPCRAVGANVALSLPPFRCPLGWVGRRGRSGRLFPGGSPHFFRWDGLEGEARGLLFHREVIRHQTRLEEGISSPFFIFVELTFLFESCLKL